MTSQVLHSNVEATYITVETASFYGVKQKPSRVLVNSQDAAFTYRANQVRGARLVNRRPPWSPCFYWFSSEWRNASCRTDGFLSAGVDCWRSGSQPQSELHHQLDVTNGTFLMAVEAVLFCVVQNAEATCS